MFCTKKSKTDTFVDSATATAHHLVDVGADKLDEALSILSPLVATATERAGQTASKLRDIASEQVGPLADQAREKATPYVSQASERIAPLAATTADYAHQAREKATPYVAQAGERLAPLAATAAGLASQAKSNLAPTWQDAVDRAQPHVDQARSRVQDDLVPQITELLHNAAAHPAVSEATKRGAAAMAAVRGDLVLPEDEPRARLLPRLVKVAIAGAAVAAVAVAVRQFLGSKDDGWTAHEPSSAYVPAPAEEAAPATTEKDEAAAAPEAASTDDQANAPVAASTTVDEEALSDSPAAATADDQATASAEDVAQDVAETEALDSATSEEPLDTPLADYFHAAAAEQESNADVTAESTSPASYGEGAYVGTEPPAEYNIKGNERSMKYHVSSSGGYERTIADVWFNSEEAAQAAGFTRAKR